MSPTHHPTDRQHGQLVRILGDVDMSDSVELGVVAVRLHQAAASAVYVDLGGISLMDIALLRFLEGLCHDDHPVMLCQPAQPRDGCFA